LVVAQFAAEWSAEHRLGQLQSDPLRAGTVPGVPNHAATANFRELNFSRFRANSRNSRIIPSGFRRPAPVFSATMFDTVKTEIATASDKLSHLRRFL
jgi:hypothetical protein